MATSFAGAFGRLRRPEYTGENRCTPCTIVNLVIAVVAAGAIVEAAVVLDAGAPVAVAVGVAAFVVFVASIYLRGYLVPGTPTFTKTYFPDWLLRRFDKRPVPTGEGTDAIDIEAYLRRVGALEECAVGDDLCLTPSFEAGWRERIDDVRDEEALRRELANVLDVDVDLIDWTEYGDALVAWVGEVEVGQWESDAAFLADLAAARELRGRDGSWSTIDVDQRGSVLNGLRLFLDECPSCTGPVVFQEETVESCCRSVDVIAVTCEECGARLFEAENPAA